MGLISRNSFNKHSAFTLVELSIVLVVIGLIVSGVLVGQQLIEAARIKGIMKEAQSYKLAFGTFVLKYNYPPGDLPNATDFWPNDSQYAGFVTNNGNGTQEIDTLGEGWTAIEHMSASGLLPGTYPGVYPCLKTDYPASKAMPEAGYVFGYTNWGYTDNRNYLEFGTHGDNSTGHCGAHYNALTYFQVTKMEEKFDDGTMTTGEYRFLEGHNQVNPTCDDLTDDVPRCRMFLLLD